MGSVQLESAGVEHAEAIQVLASHPDVAATSTLPHPYPENGALEWIALAEKERAEKSAFCFVILNAGEVAGVCSLLHVTRYGADIGYWIGRPFWGRGIATEASQQLLGFAFARIRLTLLKGQCLSHNIASKRVLQKLGFISVGTEMSVRRNRDKPERVMKFILLAEVWAERR